MSDLIHHFARLSYEEKKQKVLLILEKFADNNEVATLLTTISASESYPEVRLDEIYHTIIRYAERKQLDLQQQQEIQRNEQKQKVHEASHQENKEADILLDSLLDHRGT